MGESSDQSLHAIPGTKPYAASFVDNFMNFIKRLPLPYWLTYLILFILQSTLFHILSWIDGWVPAYEFSPLLLIYPFWLWGVLAIITYLNSISLEALASFNQLLDLEDQELKKLAYEFTTIPARGAIISAAIWSIVYFIIAALTFEAIYVDTGIGTVLIVALIIEGLCSFLLGSAIYYHSLRQLRLVNRTVKKVKHFNLFHLNPVYAFSRLTSQTGISWMLLFSFTLLCFPIHLVTGPSIPVFATQVVLAIAAFILPLWFVNRRLVAEKRRLLSELDQRVETTLGRLHGAIDASELGEVGQLNSVISGLITEREVLNKIPTWPWRTGTLTGFLSAIVIPLLLFVAQYVLSKWLGE